MSILHVSSEQSFRIISSALLSSNLSPGLLQVNTLSPGQVYLFNEHLERLKASAEAFGWANAVKKLSDQNASAVLLNEIASHVFTKYGRKDVLDCCYRLRVLVSSTEKIEIESSTITSTPGPSRSNGIFFPRALTSGHGAELWPGDLPPCVVRVDTVFTTPSLFTSHKTTRRHHYDEARERVGISHSIATEAEVLIVNPQGEIMEASLSTPYFLRSGQWVTPSSSCGGNIGTTRRWALGRQLCEEGVVKAAELVNEEDIWVSNGVRGFIKGKICLEMGHDKSGNIRQH